ncbi:transglutaminase-like domain-containing protein [Winogradskyella sediminis]|uniref:transglutaminase-like domain-containing protein n=2 Tax=Winogradskyella sediminis TaxID=1382466 RepID=UPI000E22F0F9|nr:transglutaminase-like domain-containing protein [Winogradskyella sediminis]REG87271.1 transglutaminase superfamily protein [Winogradskyella sediminis]
MKYLESTYYFDFEKESVQNLISELNTDIISDTEKTIRIYNKVRDNWKYDPYSISLLKEKYKSSHIAKKQSGNCVEKSIILIACLRALKIPARLHLGKVKNHIAVERLTEKFGSNELTPHGMVNVYLKDKWLKMSPAFNKSLCTKLNVEPLEFDGENNSFLQQYNSDGTRFMEYIDDYGHFEDVPLDFMERNIKEHYPHIFDTDETIKEFKL